MIQTRYRESRDIYRHHGNIITKEDLLQKARAFFALDLSPKNDERQVAYWRRVSDVDLRGLDLQRGELVRWPLGGPISHDRPS